MQTSHLIVDYQLNIVESYVLFVVLLSLSQDPEMGAKDREIYRILRFTVTHLEENIKSQYKMLRLEFTMSYIVQS